MKHLTIFLICLISFLSAQEIVPEEELLTAENEYYFDEYYEDFYEVRLDSLSFTREQILPELTKKEDTTDPRIPKKHLYLFALIIGSLIVSFFFIKKS